MIVWHIWSSPESVCMIVIAGCIQHVGGIYPMEFRAFGNLMEISHDVVTNINALVPPVE